MKRKALMTSRYGALFILMGGLVLSLFFPVTGFSAMDEESQPCPKPYIFTTTPRAAKAGESVIISGNRFGPTKGTVTFAPGIQAQISEWSYKKIVVTVPEHSRSGPIIVSVPCGEKSKDKYFTVVEERK
jgi:hypothetical protein